MNIKLKPIAESKVRQLGGDVCGVLVRTEDSEVMAVSEHGRCTRLDAGVMGPVDGAQGGKGAEVVAWDDPAVDPIVSKLYRKFKEWNRQGFGADDVTWCEVRGYVAELLNAQPHPAVPEGWLVRRVDDRITVQHPDIGGYCASKDGNDHSAIAPVILYHLASALLSTPTTPQADGWVRVPEGWAVVPIKPTKEMKAVCRVAGKTQVWDDMMAARPEVPSE